MTLILGFLGRAGAGKSTLAREVKAHALVRGYTTGIYEVSHLILRYCQKAGRIDKDKTRADCTPEDVQTLIDVGLEKRIEEPNYWLDCVADQILIERKDVQIIPNVRNENEAEFVRAGRGHVIRIVSTNPDGSTYISQDRDPNNRLETISETLQADFQIETPRGAESLSKAYARSLFDYLITKQN